MNLDQVLNVCLWLAGIGHFCVLAGAFMIPKVLNWREDPAQLHPMNRRLMWTYGGFIVLTITGFGILTLLYHDYFLQGNPVALGLAGFITLFWTLRLVVDVQFWRGDLWPRGPALKAGHLLLLVLFTLFVIVYATVLLRYGLGW